LVVLLLVVVVVVVLVVVVRGRGGVLVGGVEVGRGSERRVETAEPASDPEEGVRLGLEWEEGRK